MNILATPRLPTINQVLCTFIFLNSNGVFLSYNWDGGSFLFLIHDTLFRRYWALIFTLSFSYLDHWFLKHHLHFFEYFILNLSLLNRWAFLTPTWYFTRRFALFSGTGTLILVDWNLSDALCYILGVENTWPIPWRRIDHSWTFHFWVEN